MKAWDRREGESDSAYGAFREYLEMPRRSCPKVARKLSVSTSIIKRFSRENEWQARARAYDSSVTEQGRRAKVREEDGAREGLKRLARLTLEKATEAVTRLNPERISAYAAVQLVATALALNKEIVTSEPEGELTITIREA